MTKLEEELAAKVKGMEHMAREMNAEAGRLQQELASVRRGFRKASQAADEWLNRYRALKRAGDILHAQLTEVVQMDESVVAEHGMVLNQEGQAIIDSNKTALAAWQEACNG